MTHDYQAEPCPWWLGYVLANPLRKLLQNPADIVGPYVEEGMVVVEAGSGMGFFTLEMARRVGSTGKVVAVDLQPRMLMGLQKRAERAALISRLDIRLADRDKLGVSDLAGTADFVLAFYVVHELPNPAGFFREVFDSLKPGGRILIVEPRGHGGGEPGMRDSIDLAMRAGLVVLDRPTLKRNQVALLGKQAPTS